MFWAQWLLLVYKHDWRKFDKSFPACTLFLFLFFFLFFWVEIVQHAQIPVFWAKDQSTVPLQAEMTVDSLTISCGNRKPHTEIVGVHQWVVPVVSLRQRGIKPQRKDAGGRKRAASHSSSAQTFAHPKCSRVITSRVGLHSHHQACKSWPSTFPNPHLQGVGYHMDIFRISVSQCLIECCIYWRTDVFFAFLFFVFCLEQRQRS